MSAPTLSASLAHSRYSLISVAARVNPSLIGGVGMGWNLPAHPFGLQQADDEVMGRVGIDAVGGPHRYPSHERLGVERDEVGLQQDGGSNSVVNKSLT